MYVKITGRVASPPRIIKKKADAAGGDASAQQVFCITQLLNGPPGRSQYLYDVLSDEPIPAPGGDGVAQVDDLVEIMAIVRPRQRGTESPTLSAYVVRGVSVK